MFLYIAFANQFVYLVSEGFIWTSILRVFVTNPCVSFHVCWDAVWFVSVNRIQVQSRSNTRKSTKLYQSVSSSKNNQHILTICFWRKLIQITSAVWRGGVLKYCSSVSSVSSGSFRRQCGLVAAAAVYMYLDVLTRIWRCRQNHFAWYLLTNP